MSRKIAFVTYSEQPNITPDDCRIIPFIEDLVIEGIPWDAAADWETFDAVILRSCWDYHIRFAEFSSWLETRKQKETKVFNRPDTVLWNADKIYLKELAAAGIPTVPTVWLEKNSEVEIRHIVRSMGWKKAVIKPSVSATAYQTRVVAADDAGEKNQLNWTLQNSSLLLQPFIEEVVEKGEWSFIFFNKKYSHAALKRAKPGDFRVQSNFGGFIEKASAPEYLIYQAEKVLDFIKEDLLYARVDGIEIDGQFHLMELELIEPVLFLNNSQEAAGNFARAILSNL